MQQRFLAVHASQVLRLPLQVQLKVVALAVQANTLTAQAPSIASFAILAGKGMGTLRIAKVAHWGAAEML